MTVPHHRVRVKMQIGALALDVRFELRAPWTVLFGPSGSGKSTVLRAMCGLLPRDAGEVAFERREGDAWIDLGHRPVHRRALAWVPQQAAIFPHLSVDGNIDFGASVCARDPGQAVLVERVKSLLHLHALGARPARGLSGGEQQRVALARALATPNAKLLMLDEAFSSLDRATRDALLPDLRVLLEERGLPCLSVTHDVDEALQLGAEVIRLENGRVAAQGPAREVLTADRDRLLRTLG
jgi:molybdate transport system ATP-binding protein